MHLAGKVALVSGAAKGMGASHARALAKAGARVVLADVLIDQCLANASELGGDLTAAAALDVTSADDWAAAVDVALRRFGRLDILVNNAGILLPNGIEACSDADWDRVLAVNLTGAFKGIRAVIPAMREAGGGSIINVSSTAGLKGFAGVPAYVASKFGLRGLTKSAAIELAPLAIRVNSIHPGNIDTDMIEGMYKAFNHVPMNRCGIASEISKMVIFLASDDSSFSTGAEFIADGGECSGTPSLF